jgi:hypothetical protein
MTPPIAISSSSILMVAQMARFLAEVSAIEVVSSCTWAMVGLLSEKQMSLCTGFCELLFLKC